MEDKNISQSLIDDARSDIAEKVGRFIELKKNGDEYSALCPFHKEKTPSFSVNPDEGFYYCFGCGAGGDAIDFVMNFEAIDFRKAVETILGSIESGASSGEAKTKREVVKKEEEWTPLIPVPTGAGEPGNDFFRRKSGANQKLTVSSRWAYRDASGALMGYTCRFEIPGGGKDVIPQTYCVNKNTGEERWKWGSFPKPRPLYGLDKLALYPNAQVMIVEGEKAADKGQDLFVSKGVPMKAVILISWPGGAKAIKHIDWSPLAGRSVGLWPDADLKDYADNHPLAGVRMPFLHQPGTSAMMDIFDAISDSAKSVKFIVPPENMPCGWDIADATDDFPLIDFIKQNSIPASEVRERYEVVDQPAAIIPEGYDDASNPPWEGDYQDAEPQQPQQPQHRQKDSYDKDEFDESLVANGCFTILGYDQDDYYFFHHEKGQVLSRTGGQFSETGLTELAPTQWWEANFPSGGGGTCKFNKMQAINWIFRTANARGIYDPTRVRGRGAWTDKGRAVYHLGKNLIVDGKICDITKIESAYVYPMARGIIDPTPTPMTDEEGEELCETASMARWTSPGSAALLAGWVMLAPVCGALNWRPHIWITGGAGSGKTTLQTKFAASLTRGINVHANGSSSEAGIRQELGSDARPVLVDEFESNNEIERRRIESVISMIRQTSSETQARTLKGTVSGVSQQYQIRSMFCLASINTNLPTKADVDRLTVLGLRAPVKGEPDNWQELERRLNIIDMDDEVSNRLLSRALQMMPVILDTVKLFRHAAAKYFGVQRDADQYGTLLAGYWCLQKSKAPTEAEAEVILKGFSWSEYMEEHDKDDAVKALDTLLSSKIRLKDGDYSVYELIRATSLYRHQTDPTDDSALSALKRHGIRPEHSIGELWFGISHPQLISLAKETSSGTGLGGQLARIEGAKKIEPKRYNGTLSRGISVPMDAILSGEGDKPGELPI